MKPSHPDRIRLAAIIHNALSSLDIADVVQTNITVWDRDANDTFVDVDFAGASWRLEVNGPFKD